MNTISTLRWFLGLIFILGLSPTNAQSSEDEQKSNVVTTLSVLKYVAQEIGGDRVAVQSLCDPRQDPHFVQPRPTLMKKTREADVFIEVGLQLELWSQKVIDGSGNPKIQSGQPGRVIASTGISTLELPQVLSREWGDIHPYGNPHVWLDPLNVKKMASNIATAFQRLDPSHENEYSSRLQAFDAKIDTSLFGEKLVRSVGARKLTRLAEQGILFDYFKDKGLTEELGGWLKKAECLRGEQIVTYHKTWIYLAKRFGLTIPVEIEDKPGITPSARHRDYVVQVVKQNEIKALVVSSFYDRSAADYIAEKTGADVVVVPIDIGTEGIDNYFALIDSLISNTCAPLKGGA
jgi:zinc/manganese transport system substrate-binding protein